MELFTKNRAALLAVGFAFLTLPTPSASYGLTGCSTENTGTGHQATSDIYLSLGKCHDLCQSEYAFAIVQGDICWCSNFAPASTVQTSQCDTPCPGYPYEYCASTSSGLFGYLSLNDAPSGTMTGPTAIASGTGSSNSGSGGSSAAATSSPEGVAPVVVSASVETPYVSVKTVLGSVQTVTISPTAPQGAAQTSQPSSTAISNASSFWSNTGKVAGTFTVVGLIIAGIIGAGIFFFFRRWKKNEDAMTVGSREENPTSSNGAPYMVDRRRSNLTLATAGLAGLTRGSSHEKSPVENNNKTPASMSRRGSIPPSHDQRLNPAALWNTAHPNGSHVSVATFQDDRDYSRPVLHVRNPDVQ